MTIAARAGYGARGVLYLLIGTLAVLAAWDIGDDAVGARGALQFIFAQPLGYLLLGALAAGFACLAAWRLIQAWADPSNYGSDPIGLGIRFVLAVSAFVHGGIAISAIRLMMGWDIVSRGGGGSAIPNGVASIMAAPFGPWIAGVVGLIIIGMGIVKGIKAWRAEFGEHLECADHIRLWAVPVSRFGLTARGVVFVLIGSSITVAAYRLKADQAAGLAGVLRALEQTPFGWTLPAAAALGLAAFGIFGLIEAFYRRIDARDID